MNVVYDTIDEVISKLNLFFFHAYFFSFNIGEMKVAEKINSEEYLLKMVNYQSSKYFGTMRSLLLLLLATIILSISCFREESLEQEDIVELTDDVYKELTREKRSPDPDPRGTRKRKKEPKRKDKPAVSIDGNTNKDDALVKPGDKTVYGKDGSVISPYPKRSAAQNDFGERIKELLVAITTAVFAIIYHMY